MSSSGSRIRGKKEEMSGIQESRFLEKKKKKRGTHSELRSMKQNHIPGFLSKRPIKPPPPPSLPVGSDSAADQERDRRSGKLKISSDCKQSGNADDAHAAGNRIKPPKQNKARNPRPSPSSSRLSPSAGIFSVKGRPRSLTPPLEPRSWICSSLPRSPPSATRTRSSSTLRPTTAHGLRNPRPPISDRSSRARINLSKSAEFSGSESGRCFQKCSADASESDGTLFFIRERPNESVNVEKLLGMFSQSDPGVGSSCESSGDELGFPPPHVPDCSLSSHSNDDDGYEDRINSTITSDFRIHSAPTTEEDEDASSSSSTTDQPFGVIDRGGVLKDLGNGSIGEDLRRDKPPIRTLKPRSHVDHASSLDRIISKVKTRIKKLVTPDHASSNQLNCGEKPVTSPLSGPQRRSNLMDSAVSRSALDHAERMHQGVDNHAQRDSEADRYVVEENRKADQHAENHQEADPLVVQKHKKAVKFEGKHKKADVCSGKYQKADQHVRLMHPNPDPSIGVISHNGHQDVEIISALEHLQGNFNGERNNENSSMTEHKTKNYVELDHRSGMLVTKNLEDAVRRLGSLHGEHEAAAVNDSRLHLAMEEKENLISLERVSASWKRNLVEVLVMKQEAIAENMSNVACLEREMLSKKSSGALGEEKNQHNTVGCKDGASFSSRSHDQNLTDGECEVASDSEMSSQREEILEGDPNSFVQGSIRDSDSKVNEIRFDNVSYGKAPCGEFDEEVPVAGALENEAGIREIAAQEVESENMGNKLLVAMSTKKKKKTMTKKKKVQFSDACKAIARVENGMEFTEHNKIPSDLPDVLDEMTENCGSLSSGKGDASCAEPDNASPFNDAMDKETVYIRSTDNGDEGDAENEDQKNCTDHQAAHREQRCKVSGSLESISKLILNPSDGHDQALKSTAVGSSSSDLLIQEHIHSWLSRIEADLQRRVDEAVADSMKEIKVSLREDVENSEIGRVQEAMGNLQKEVEVRSHESKHAFRHVESKLAEISHVMDQTAEQLHSVREDGTQCRSRLDGLKKATDEQIHGIKSAMDRSDSHDYGSTEKLNCLVVQECKEKISGLEAMVELLRSDLAALKKLKDVEGSFSKSEAARKEGAMDVEKVEAVCQSLETLARKEMERSYGDLGKEISAPERPNAMEIRILELEKGQEVLQDFEHELGRFCELRSSLEREKNAIAILSQQISRSAQGLVHDMDELREKNAKLSEELLSELSRIRSENKGMPSHRYEDMHAKLVSLEGSQHSLNCEVGGVKEKAKEIEESVAQWLPKYDAAARALDEVQKRLAKLEACGQERRLLDSEDPFQKLYKDLSAMRRPNEPATRWPPALQYKSNPSGLDARPFLVLESRIEHVASAAYMNFRILDTKFEHMSRDLETTLKCAGSAEEKCNLVAAEIIKVFRMLANASKTNAGKLHMSPLSGARSATKAEFYPMRKKVPLSTARVNQRKHVIPPGETKHSFRGIKACERNDSGRAAKKASDAAHCKS